MSLFIQILKTIDYNDDGDEEDKKRVKYVSELIKATRIRTIKIAFCICSCITSNVLIDN